MKKLLAAVLVLIMCLPIAAGCGKTVDKEGTIQIKMLEAGYSTKFMEELIAEFKVLEPSIDIELDPVVALGADTVEGEMTSNNNPYDLYLSGAMFWRKFIKVDGTSDVLYDMSEFYKTNPRGEDKSIEEKMNDNFLKYNQEAGKYWTLNWAGASCGLAVNLTALGDRPIPRTTKEFVSTIEQISAIEKAQADKKKKVYPLIWSGLAWDYWRYVLNCWWAQYEGVAAYDRYWQCMDEDGELSANVYLQDGILKGLEELEKVLYHEYSYPGSIALAHTDGQAQFMLNRAVFTVTGDWIESEMKRYKNDDIRMMKPPVNSNLAEKLQITEEQLILAIDAVDGGIETPPANISQAAFDEIKKARSLHFSIGTNHSLLIPKSSNAIVETKKFLQFMYSQRGIEIVYQNAGTLLPFENSINTDSEYFKGLTPYKQSKYNLEKNIEYIFFDYTSPLRWKAGLQQFYGPANQPELLFSQQSESQRKSAYDVWMDEYTTVSGSWDSYLSASGLEY